MRLVMAMAGARHGGAEAFFERLAVAFNERAVDLRVVVRGDAERTARLRAAGIEPVELPFRNWFDIATRRGLRRLVDTFQPDTLLSFMSRAAARMPRRRSGDAFVHVGRLGGYYNLKYYRRCDHLIANTPDIRDYLLRNEVDAQRAHYVPNFVDGGEATPAARADLGTPDDAKLVAAFGRLHRNKAFDVLLRAMADLPGVHLWLAGEGPLRADLERQTAELGLEGRVRFLGWRDDVRPLIAAADLVAVPSRHEPLGNVVIEAWAQSKPVVAAASQGPAQLIDPNETGILVPADDAAALAGAMRAVLDEPALAARLAEAGRRAYEGAYTRDIVVQAYLDLFETLVNTREGAVHG